MSADIVRLSASFGALEDAVRTQNAEDTFDDRFVEACQMLDYIEYLADILTVGDLEERVAVVDELMKEGKITFLKDYVTRKRKEGLPHGKKR